MRSVLFFVVLTGCSGPAVGPGIRGVEQLATGRKHVCALQSSNQLTCWGDDTFGQVSLAPTGGVLDVDAGEAHSCAVLEDGSVVCWGRNTDGRLGASGGSRPVTVPRVEGAVAVAVGFTHSCARLAGGRVMCWGSNAYGQLGEGSLGEVSGPVEVRGVSNAVEIAAGGYHTCARLASGQVSCWGRNDVGQLGLSGMRHEESVTSPGIVAELSDAARISTGSMHTCALRESDGEVWCWGWNFSGQLGDGTLTNRAVPTRVALPDAAVAVSAGRSCCPTTGEHTCAVLERGDVWCWGDNLAGQLGSGDFTSSMTPVRVQGLEEASEIQCGSMFSCATHAEVNALSCWGYNDAGQLGSHPDERRVTPTRVED